jgi:hypothetical protein
LRAGRGESAYRPPLNDPECTIPGGLAGAVHTQAESYRVLRSIFFGLGAAVATFFVAAIFFAVLDIYLTGHGRWSLMQHQLVARRAVQLSVADAVALALSAAAGVIAFVGSLRR